METLDHTQFLPRGTPVVNKYRMQHGDLDGKVEGSGKEMRITGAWAKDNTVIRRLIRAGFLEEYHLMYGLTLLDLRKSLYGKLGAKSNAVYIAMMGDEPITRGYAARMYEDVTIQITLPVTRIIFRAIQTEVDKAPECHVIQAINVYMRSFEKLVTVTDDVVAIIKAEIEKGVA
jgi:hypothetical protein